MEQSATALAAEVIRVQLARQKRNGTWLATELGVAPATVSRWLSGDRTISVAILARIADALGVPVWTLLIDQTDAA